MSSDPSLNTDPLPEEFLALSQMTTGDEAAAYYRKYLESIGEPPPAEFTEVLDTEPIEVHLNTRGCEPMQPETAKALARMFRAAARQIASGIPCPRCGSIVNRRSPQGRREEWECDVCGFGFDLPTTE